MVRRCTGFGPENQDVTKVLPFLVGYLNTRILPRLPRFVQIRACATCQPPTLRQPGKNLPVFLAVSGVLRLDAVEAGRNELIQQAFENRYVAGHRKRMRKKSTSARSPYAAYRFEGVGQPEFRAGPLGFFGI